MPTPKAARNRTIEWPQSAIRPASFVPPGLLGAQELGQGHEDGPRGAAIFAKETVLISEGPTVGEHARASVLRSMNARKA